MNKITRLYLFIVLSVMIIPTAIFANDHSSSIAEINPNNQQRHMYNNDPYSQAEQNQTYSSNSEVIGDRSWETSSSRMNRQAAATSNVRSNPNQNRDEQTDNSWETSSSRMNRQAIEHANTRLNSTWIRKDQNRNDSNTSTGSSQR